MKYIVALDQGTTSSRAVVFDRTGRQVAAHGIEFKQHYPQPGWVEHDPEDIIGTQRDALVSAVQQAGIEVADIEAIGITNQRETVLLWDRRTGRPVINAIVWQCRRSAPLVEAVAADGATEAVRQKTGLEPDAYFSATKIQWALNNVSGLRAKAEAGDVLFGTVDTFLLWRLTGGKAHLTDASNASRTMLYNIHTGAWDEELLRYFGIPAAMLPRVADTAGLFGVLDKSVLGREIPITAMAGDQQAALFGQACFRPGMVKNTYGTGCFLLMNTGDKPALSKNRLLTSVAWSLGGHVTYMLEGSVFVAGGVVQWLRDEMGLIDTAAQSEAVAASVPDSQGVYVVPAFTGLGAPYWDMYGRGAILGLTRGTGRAHIVRAALEGIAYQTADVMEAMRRDGGVDIAQVRVDGGASANNLLMGVQADVLGIPVVRPRVIETTAMGAAMLAGHAVGLWDSLDALEGIWEQDAVFYPRRDDTWRLEAMRGWHRAVLRAMRWAD